MYEALVSIAVAQFRMGEEKGAQAALGTIARLDAAYKLPEGKFPPVFVREFEKAKKKVEKAAKGSISVDGPPGATAFVNGRDLGMVPAVDENLAIGTHHVVVEGTRGERFGQTVEVKGGTVKVRGVFSGAGSSAASPSASVTAPDPRVSATLDSESAVHPGPGLPHRRPSAHRGPRALLGPAPGLLCAARLRLRP